MNFFETINFHRLNAINFVRLFSVHLSFCRQRLKKMKHGKKKQHKKIIETKNSSSQVVKDIVINVWLFDFN